MPRIEVTYKTDEIPNKLKEISSKKGYKSREEYLRVTLEKIANEEYETETAMLYRQSLEKVTKGLQGIYDILLLNAELAVLKLPDLSSEEKE